MLEAENKKMEEKLKVVQGLMNAEREKRAMGPNVAAASPGAASASSSKMWRSSTQSANHAKQVLEQHKQALSQGLKPRMPGANDARPPQARAPAA